MKHSNKWKLLGLSLLLPWFSAQAQVEVNVSGAQVAARPIAILPIQGDPGVKMDYLIASDLHKTGLFQPLDPSSFPAAGADNYPAWKQAGADYVVSGNMQGGSSGQFSLGDINAGNVLASDNLSDADARQLAHQVSDWILYRLTGKRGVFGTQLAYILEQGGKNGRKYSLVVSDVDGANRRELYTSSEPILSPSWAPNGRAIAFVTYANHYAQIVIQELGGGRRVVAQGNGISSAPAFSPDGNYLAFVQSDNNNPDIYLLNLASGGKTRLTDHSAIDTEPAFSPDGNYIYFTSDRSGSQSGGGYQIGTYDLASKRFDALTNGRLDEGASFAPNGQLIIYATKEGGRSVLKVINSKGGVAQTLSDPNGRLRDPAWSPDTRP